MKKLLLLIIVSLMLAGVASARTVWRPQLNTPPIVGPGAGDWNDPCNWDNGIPTSDEFGDPGDPCNVTGKVVFFEQLATAECRVTDPNAVCLYFVLGDNEPMVAPLVIKDGGTLTTGGTGWSGVGFNNPGALLIVDRGGTVNLDSHLWVAMNTGAVGTVIVDGGTITVADALGLGRNAGAVGEVYINSGLIECRYMGRATFTGQPSFIDIGFGTLVLTNNNLDRANELIAIGDIIGFGGASTVTAERVSLDGGGSDVYITAAPDPMDRYPTMEDFVDADPCLSWTNLVPVAPAADVWVDVWFGTDPTLVQDETDPNIWESGDFVLVVDAGKNTTEVGVPTPTNGGYFWRVVTYRHGNPVFDIYNYGDDPNVLGPSVDEGILMYFFATDDFPPSVTIDTPPTATWKGEPIPLTATINDDGVTPLIIVWSSDEDPNATFSNVQYSEIADPCNPGDIIGTATADVTVDYDSGAFNVTITVTDENPIGPGDSNTDTVNLDCRQNACAAARDGVGLDAVYPSDLVADCEHTLADFAIIAADWLTDYALKDPQPMPE